MRTHTFKLGKGYAPEYVGREITWQVPQTVEEAIASGEFKDEATLVGYATAQLNIRKGHAVMDATKEKGEDDRLANPAMSASAMEAVAAGVKADGIRAKGTGTGGAKVKAAKFEAVASKVQNSLKDASPEKIALLRELGLLPEGYEAPATATATPARRGK